MNQTLIQQSQTVSAKTSKTAAASASEAKRPFWHCRPWLRQLGLVAVLIGLGFLTVGSLGLLAAGRDPSALREIRRQIAAVPPVERLDRAKAFEGRLGNLLTEPFPGEPMIFADSKNGSGLGVSRIDQPDGSVRIGLDSVEFNLWLKERLGDWLASRDLGLPEGVDLWVALQDEAIHVIATDPSRLGGRPISLELVPRVEAESGQFFLKIKAAKIGRMPLPSGIVNEQIGSLHEGLKAALNGDGLDPAWPIDDIRGRRLTDVEVDETQLWLTLKAESRGESVGLR